jgi:rod shape determining protein RodA
LAFGVGGIEGTGFRNGEVKKGGFIPEQHNDFIFTVIGEEGGLIGCTLVLAGFGFFFFRAWLIMFRATEPFYKMMAVGIMGTLAFHAIVNMGMNLQILPVVGLWLPFMSYGGTAMWLCLSCVALLLNIKRHERPVLF